MGNKIIFLNSSYITFLQGARLLLLILVDIKKYTPDLNFEKIASLAS